MFGSVSIAELVIVVTVVIAAAVIVVVPAARICSRAGFPAWLGIAAVVPGANLLLLWFLAFAQWPARRDGA